MFTSQPLAEFKSQLANPGLQEASVQTALTHADAPFAADGQARLHWPQLLLSEERLAQTALAPEPHKVCPAGQVATQLPAPLQASPVPQAVPAGAAMQAPVTSQEPVWQRSTGQAAAQQWLPPQTLLEQFPLEVHDPPLGTDATQTPFEQLLLVQSVF